MYNNAQPNNVFELKVTSSGNSRVVSRCHRSMGQFDRNATSATDNYRHESCYTAATAHLAAGDVVRVQNMYSGSLVSTVPQHSFIGFIRLSHGR